MKEKLKYFIINKETDFRRGSFEKMDIEGGSLRFASPDESGVGRFLTRVFDCGEKQTLWHRLLIGTENCERHDLRVVVYAAELTEFKYAGNETSVQAVLTDSELSLDKKLEMLERFIVKKTSGARDILLHDVSGRYVWFLIEAYSRSGQPAALTEIKIFLPAVSLIDDLPQIYRKNDRKTGFLERYLAIFQTFYEELNSKIENIAEYFDPACAEADFLEWIASWLDISDVSLWPEDKLRKFLLRAVQLYRKRGTRESLSEILELYTGERPYIVENSELLQLKNTDMYRDTLMPMYGNNPYRITVLIKSSLVKNQNELNAIKKIASEMIPVSMELNVILLEPYIFLNRFSYAGINSVLGSYKPAALDGKSSITLSQILSQDLAQDHSGEDQDI